MIRIAGTGLTGELVCGIDGDVLVDLGQHGKRQVPAVLVEVVAGGDFEAVDRQVIEAARARVGTGAVVSRLCRHRSRFGQCGLPADHTLPDEHAVPIGDGVWFRYLSGRPRATAIGYVRLLQGGTWEAL